MSRHQIQVVLKTISHCRSRPKFEPPLEHAPPKDQGKFKVKCKSQFAPNLASPWRLIEGAEMACWGGHTPGEPKKKKSKGDSGLEVPGAFFLVGQIEAHGDNDLECFP